MLTPRVRLVSSRTRSVKRSTAFGAIRRLGVSALVKLNPRNFRSHGCATALFGSFTLSLSLVVMNRVRLFKGGRTYLGRSAVSPGNETEGRGIGPDRTAEVSRGRIRRATAGFTTSAFDGYGLRGQLPARPAPYASDPVFVHRLASWLRASFRHRLTTTPLRFAITSRPSRCEEDLHLLADDHARHTTKRPEPQPPVFLFLRMQTSVVSPTLLYIWRFCP
jgi:hypothetical protein